MDENKYNKIIKILPNYQKLIDNTIHTNNYHIINQLNKKRIYQDKIINLCLPYLDIKNDKLLINNFFDYFINILEQNEINPDKINIEHLKIYYSSLLSDINDLINFKNNIKKFLI